MDEQLSPDEGVDRTRLNGFLSVRWGESADSAREKMLRRQGIRLDSTTITTTIMILHMGGGELLGRNVSEFTLSFFPDLGMYSANVMVRKKTTMIWSMCSRLLRDN